MTNHEDASLMSSRWSMNDSDTISDLISVKNRKFRNWFRTGFDGQMKLQFPDGESNRFLRCFERFLALTIDLEIRFHQRPYYSRDGAEWVQSDRTRGEMASRARPYALIVIPSYISPCWKWQCALTFIPHFLPKTSICEQKLEQSLNCIHTVSANDFRDG